MVLLSGCWRSMRRRSRCEDGAPTTTRFTTRPPSNVLAGIFVKPHLRLLSPTNELGVIHFEKHGHKNIFCVFFRWADSLNMLNNSMVRYARNGVFAGTSLILANGVRVALCVRIAQLVSSGDDPDSSLLAVHC
jgi:hypothetical protein